MCLCYAEADRAPAESIAARFERTAEVRVWLETARTPVNEMWDRGLGSAGIVLLLSPHSVAEPFVLGEWKDLIDHTSPPVVCVELAECRYPPLLKRRRWFRWSDPNALRELHRWAIGLHAVPDPPPFAPAAVPGIDAPQYLWETLVDQPGCLEVDQTDVAQQFAHAAAPFFRDVVWIACARRSPPCIAGEICAQLSASLDGPEDEALQRAVGKARKHRLLLVLDGLEPEFVVPVPEGSGSVLVTRRSDLPRAAEEPADAALFEAMSACVPGAFPLELPASMIGLRMDKAVAAADRLATTGLVARLDRSGSRHRLRARAHPRKVEGLRGKHAAELCRAFTRRSTNHATALRYLSEVEIAIRWAVMRDWGLATQLTYSAGSFLRDLKRDAESAFLYDILLWAAKEQGDDAVISTCESELLWIRGGMGGTLRQSAAGPAQQLGLFI